MTHCRWATGLQFKIKRARRSAQRSRTFALRTPFPHSLRSFSCSVPSLTPFRRSLQPSGYSRSAPKVSLPYVAFQAGRGARKSRGKAEKPSRSFGTDSASNVDKLRTTRVDKPLTGMDNSKARCPHLPTPCPPVSYPRGLTHISSCVRRAREIFPSGKVRLFRAPRPSLHFTAVLPFGAESEPPPPGLHSLCHSVRSVTALHQSLRSLTLYARLTNRRSHLVAVLARVS